MVAGFLRKPICGDVRGPFGPKPQFKQTQRYHTKIYFYGMDFF